VHERNSMWRALWIEAKLTSDQYGDDLRGMFAVQLFQLNDLDTYQLVWSHLDA